MVQIIQKDLISDLSFIPGIKMEDYPHTYTALSKHPRTVILNVPLYHYTPNPRSISAEQLDVKTIRNYQMGLDFVIEAYKTASKKEKRFVLHELFPNILKQQFNKILRSPKEKQPELYAAFAKELTDFNEKGWLKLWGGQNFDILRPFSWKTFRRQLISIRVREKKLVFCHFKSQPFKGRVLFVWFWTLFLDRKGKV